MSGKKITLDKTEILEDFYLAHLSRKVAILGKREVLSGKAKFGIFGDGKEIAQIAMAKRFRNGDWRSGYYRDHTFMMAAGLFTAGLIGESIKKTNKVLFFDEDVPGGATAFMMQKMFLKLSME